jgi:hypothetical protein
MKKALFSFLGLLATLISPLYGEWVFLHHLEVQDVPNIEFIEFTDPEFDNYIIIIDGLRPTNTSYNLMMQLGFKAEEASAPYWITSNSGGICSFKASETQVVSTKATALGIPVTNIANNGTTFSGEVWIHNTGMGAKDIALGSYGPLALYGVGALGFDATAFISGTFNSAGPVNCIRFISSNPIIADDAIAHAKITIYGLRQIFP